MFCNEDTQNFRCTQCSHRWHRSQLTNSMYYWVFNAAGSTTPQIQQGSLSSTESSNENSSFSVSIVGTCIFDGPGC